MDNPAAKGDPFDTASFLARVPTFPIQTPSPTTTPPALAMPHSTTAELSSSQKKSPLRVKLAHVSPHVNSPGKLDDEPSVTILSPLPNEEPTDVNSKSTPDDASLVVPVHSSVDDNTNAVDIPGMTAAQSRQSQFKANADPSPATLSPTLTP